MSIPDIINGGFEAWGGAAILLNVRQILKDKRVQGVDVKATAFFTSWGLWNLFYYPSLDQWMSFVGGLMIVAANTVWLVLALKYRTVA